MPIRSPFRPRTYLIAGGCAGAAAVTVSMVILLQPRHHISAPPKVVANDYSGRATACLATDTTTAGKSKDVAKIWAAMQSAGTQGGKNVQQVIQPATTAEQAQPYLAGLVSQRCDLIVTVGPTFGQAIQAIAKAAPAAQFTAVDSSLTAPATSVTLVPMDQAAARVQQQVLALRHSTASGS
ncbi:hypothetical protein OG500_11455 [Kitasatospora sp. NBC_01250]|uniref:hypothetical protein n=1 Tax=Kitasatospora sp. NBC_01250 TaxID=2903571 RepID=UPI002E332053|nr:hypothetical protein [Kitasatospora sp. NBC_01250]